MSSALNKPTASDLGKPARTTQFPSSRHLGADDDVSSSAQVYLKENPFTGVLPKLVLDNQVTYASSLIDFQSVIAEVNSTGTNQTIYLLRDIVLTAPLVIPTGLNIIGANNVTVSCVVPQAIDGFIINGDDIVISNITFKNFSSCILAALPNGGRISKRNLRIDRCNFVSMRYAIYNNNEPTIYISSCKIRSSSPAGSALILNAGSVVVDNSNIITTEASLIIDDGSIVVPSSYLKSVVVTNTVFAASGGGAVISSINFGQSVGKIVIRGCRLRAGGFGFFDVSSYDRSYFIIADNIISGPEKFNPRIIGGEPTFLIENNHFESTVPITLDITGATPGKVKFRNNYVYDTASVATTMIPDINS
jgi:hypothetical protein